MIVGAVDCTGHGVPGAFMTLIGSKRFQRAITKFSAPGEILREVNRGLKEVLHQSAEEGSVRDGVDGVMCNINLITMKLSYAGANRPLWIIKKDSSDSVSEIKPTRYSLGGRTSENTIFETHEIDIQKGDLIYLFSDGYCDQFNSQNQKILPFRLKEMLLENKDKPLHEQSSQLESFLLSWQGNCEQTDDIQVFGLKV